MIRRGGGLSLSQARYSIALAGASAAAGVHAGRRGSVTRSSRSAATAVMTFGTTALRWTTIRRRNQLTGTAAIDATATQDLSSSTSTSVGSRSPGCRQRPRASFRVTAKSWSSRPGSDPRRLDVHGDGRLPGHADRGHRPGPIDRGLGADRRRRVSVGEPQGSPGWYAVNDNPQDKATFDFAITVPAGLTAMANGVLVSQETSGGTTTWVWHEADPMAPYLATATSAVST